MRRGIRTCRILTLGAAVSAATILGGIAAATAQPSDGFYKGKSIDLVIGFNAGDTYDIYSRLAANHLSRFIPGNPNVVPRNMPGAGSLKSASYIYAQAPKDGTVIGMAGQAIAFEQLVKNPAVLYDARQFNWIGRMVPVIQFIVAWHTVPVKTIEDAMKRELILAATSPTGVTGTAPRLLNQLGGTKFKIVHGYQGVSGTMLAMERGETEAGTATAQTLLFGRPELLATPLVSVLVQYSRERNHLFANVPAMGEFGRTEEEKTILQLYGSTAELGRALMAPPGVPEARLKTLREAFNAMMKDPEFIADTKKSKMEIDALDAAGVAKVVAQTIDVPTAIAQAVAEAIKQ